MFPQVQGIDVAGLAPQDRNAFEVLSHLDLPAFNQIKTLLELGQPGVLGPQTLAEFRQACAGHGVDLSDAGVNAFKDSHGFGNTGPLKGLIGPQTAAAFAHALVERMSHTGTTPTQGRTINALGLALVKEFEGLAQRIPGDPQHVRAYLDSVHVPTIGYGHTKGVHLGQVIPLAQAEAFLREDLASAERDVERLVTAAINDNQFSALVSFVFNLGAGALKQSTLLKRVNAGQFQEAATEFGKWVNAGGQVLPGLVKRRRAEQELFLH